MKKVFIIIFLVISCKLSAINTPIEQDDFSVAKSYYDSAFNCLVNQDFIGAMPKFIKTAELIERLPEDMSDEEMHLTSRAYYQMGEIFGKTDIYSYEIETIKRASYYQEFRQDTLWMLRSRRHIASAFQVMREYDSVDYYLKQIVPLSDSSKYVEEYWRMLHIMATQQYDKKEYDSAFILHQDILDYKNGHGLNTIGDSISVGIHLFFSPYRHKSKPYLLKMYRKIETDPNVSMYHIGGIASFLSQLYEEEGNTDSLMICNKLFAENVHEMTEEISDDMTLKYMYEQFKARRDNFFNELLMQKEKERNRNIAIISFAVISIISVVIVMKTRRKSKSEEINIEDTAVYNYEEAWKIFEQSEMVKNIKSMLKTDGGEKISVKNIEECGIEKLGKTELKELKDYADNVFGGRITRLSEQYAELTPSDIYCCCFVLMGLTNSEMAVLFGVKYNAINARVTKIKKVFNTNENLRDFVIRNLGE